MGQETTPAWESRGHDDHLSDSRNDIGRGVEVFVDHARSVLRENEEMPSLRVCSRGGLEVTKRALDA